MDRGKLITIEGLDGAGKTTLATALAADLAARGVTVSQLREPGGEAVSERIRELLREPALAGALDARAEALLYAAARAQLTASKLMPQLKAGTWILLDRFVDSSLAYQGGGRQLGVETIRAVNLFATAGLTPDRTLLLHLDPRAGRMRQQARATEPDRIEREDHAFFETVAATYDELAAADPQRIRRLDATASPNEVLRQALQAIEDLLPAQRHA